MTTVELEKVEKEQDNDDAMMWHITYGPDDFRTFCGYVLPEVDGPDEVGTMDMVDCVVCFEMWKNQ